MAGMNRAQRRQQERQQIKEWRNSGKINQVLSIQRNGLTSADLDKAYKDGYTEGYMYASEAFLRKIYAAVAKELIDAGKQTDEIVEFVKNVDHRFAVMFDAEEEIADVYEQIGVTFNVDRNALNRIE